MVTRFDDKWGAMGSLTFARSTENKDDYINKSHERSKTDYYSVMVGPTYSINKIFTTYALVGFTNMSGKYESYNENEYEMQKMNKHAMGLGLGVIANVTDSFSVKAGYEYSRYKFKDGESSRNVPVNGFNIGVGYSF